PQVVEVQVEEVYHNGQQKADKPKGREAQHEVFEEKGAFVRADVQFGRKKEISQQKQRHSITTQHSAVPHTQVFHVSGGLVIQEGLRLLPYLLPRKTVFHTDRDFTHQYAYN